MAQRALRLLLIDAVAEDAERLRRMLEDAHEMFQVRWARTLVEGLNVLAAEDVDAILLDVTLPDSSGAGTVTAVRSQAQKVPLLVWTRMDNHAVSLSVVEAGAEDCLAKDRLTGPALVRALRYAVARQQVRESDEGTPAGPRAMLIGLLGVKGGVGTTTLACHLAAELRVQTREAVLLVDLDLDLGLAGFMLKAHAPYSILDAAANLHRLDLGYWKAMLARHESGLEVMPAPVVLSGEERSGDRIRHVLRFLRAHYRWILVDLGRPCLLSLAVAREMSEVYLVASLEPAALFHARRLLGQLGQEGGARESCRLVLNRTGPHDQVSGADLERMVGARPRCSLISSWHELNELATEGRLLPASSPLRRQIAAWAAELAGLEPARTAKSSLRRLLAR